MTVWGVAMTFDWWRTPARRGALGPRWRDLRASVLSPSLDVVDLSRDAAARLVAVGAGSIVRGLSYLLIVGAGFVELGWLGATVLFVSIVLIYTRWLNAANTTYRWLTGRPSAAFDRAPVKYMFPGSVWRVLRTHREALVSEAILIAGLAMISIGAPLAYRDDALLTPIPHTAVSDTGLPPGYAPCSYSASVHCCSGSGYGSDARSGELYYDAKQFWSRIGSIRGRQSYSFDPSAPSRSWCRRIPGGGVASSGCSCQGAPSFLRTSPHGSSGLGGGWSPLLTPTAAPPGPPALRIIRSPPEMTGEMGCLG